MTVRKLLHRVNSIVGRRTAEAAAWAAPWSASWFGARDGWSSRRRLIALLRRAYRVVGLGRQRGLGMVGLGSRRRHFGAAALAVVAASSTLSQALGQAYQAGAGATAAGTNATAVGSNSFAANPGGTALGSGASAGTAGSTQTFNDTALGYNAKSTSGSGVAIGDTSLSTANGAVAVGATATALGASGIALGNAATAVTGGAVAVGFNATAKGGQAVAIGPSASANGNGAVAIGNPNAAAGTGAVAIGAGNTASGNGSVAIGDSNLATGLSAVAVGNMSNAGGNNAVAVGNMAEANALSGTSLGAGAIANNSNDVALGAASTTTMAVATGGTTLGNTSYTFAGTAPASTVSIGALGAERTLTNLAAGRISATSTDGVNGSELYATNQAVSGIVTGKVGPFVSDNSVTTVQPVSSGANASAGGFGAMATGAASTVIGNASTDNGVANSTVIGQGASIAAKLGGSNAAIGQGSTVTAAAVPVTGATIGSTTYTFAGGAPMGAVSFGTAQAPRQLQNVAAGQLTAASMDAVNGSQLFATDLQVANNATSVTTLTTSITNGTIGVIQRNGTTNQLVAVAPGGTAAAPGAVQTLTNVAPGALTAASTDAVNGSQLYATNNQITGLGTSAATNFGGGTTYNATTGALTAPTYNVYGTPQATVGGAIAALQTAGPVQYSNAAGVPTPQTPGNNATLVGATAGTPVALHNVAPGALTATSTDAVNGSQLTATNAQVAGNTTNLTSLTTNITNGTVGVIQRTGTANQLAAIAAGGTAAAPGPAQLLTNIAPGALTGTSTDAVNGSQLYATNQTVNNITNGKAGPFVSDNSVTAVPPMASAADSTAGGFGASATGTASTVIGNGGTDNGNASSTVIGQGASIAAGLGGSNVAIGQGSAVTVAAAPTIGANFFGTPYAGEVPTGAVSFGTAQAPRLLQNVAAGAITATSLDAVNGSQLFATQRQVIGNTTTLTNLTTNVTNGTIGPIERTGNPNQLAAVAANGTATAPGAAQTLTNIAPGALTATSTDAVNGSQLFTTNAQVASLGGSTATNLGGGATYNAATGAVTAPSYNVYGTLQGNVGAAIAALQTAAPVQYSNAAGVPTPQTPGNNATLVGATAGTPVALHNVAPGALTATSTDAVNGSQLYATNQTINNITNGKAGAFVSDGSVTTAQPVASGANASAGGFGASATGGASLVVGNNATDNGNANSTVIGQGATVAAGLGGSNVALGQGSTVAAAAVPVASTAIGGNLYTFAGAAPVGAVSIGTAQASRQLQNVAAGQLAAGSTDGVNGSQLFATNTQVTANTNAINNITIGAAGPVQRTATADQLALVAPGGSGTMPGTAQNLTNVAAGRLAATSTDAVNGSQLFATNAQVAITTNEVTGLGTLLGGNTSFNPQTGAVTGPTFNIGGGTQTTYYDAINALQQGGAIKYFHATSAATDSVAGGLDSVAIGPAATTAASAPRAMSLGSGAAATGADSVALGSGSTAGAANTPGTGIAATLTNANGAATGITYNTTDRTLLGPVSVGSANSWRQIQNVADGQNAMDAVNVRQLQRGVQTAISYTDTYAVSYGQNGVTLASPYAGGPVVIHNVGAGAVNATSTDAVNGAQLFGVQQVANNSVQYATNADGSRSNTVVLAGGNPGAPVRVSNVAPGVAGTDAVNVNQLNNLAAYNQGQINNLNRELSNTNQALRGGVAVALAAAGLRYDDRPGKVSVSAGAAGYGGSAGLAFGLGGTSYDGKIRLNAAVSFSPNNNHTDVGVFGGGTYTFN